GVEVPWAAQPDSAPQVRGHHLPTTSSPTRPVAASGTRLLASRVTSTDLNAGVFEPGSVVAGTSTFASGKYMSALPARMSKARRSMLERDPVPLSTVTH